MFFTKPKPQIEFLCATEDFGVIAEPEPAKAHLPAWFKRLPPINKDKVSPTDNGLTVKRCMPFLDAMTSGWIIRLAATVRLEISEGGKTVNAGWDFDKVMVSNHNAYQIAGNPLEPRPPSKFHNYWTVVTPPGWSCLFVHPLNRDHEVFRVLSGIVETDSYASLIHFPFVATASDGIYVLEKGTPLVQVIPFKRDTTDIEASIRQETQEEAENREKIRRNTQSEEGWYRKHARTRIVKE